MRVPHLRHVFVFVPKVEFGELHLHRALYQGTTSVVPQMQSIVVGFSP
jgi:hypothetical protein